MICMYIMVYFILTYSFTFLIQAYLLFGDEEYLFIFQEAYKAAMNYLFNDPWQVIFLLRLEFTRENPVSI